MRNTDFAIDDYVVYKGVGVCRVEAVENKTFDGKNFEDYLKLVPLDTSSSSYFVPLSADNGRLRKPMTPDEVNETIDLSQDSEITLTHNTKERRSEIDTILKSNDFTRILALIKTIYLHTVSCRSSGKKVLVSDENALRAAENMIYPEFSFVLGIDQKDVAAYIGSRLQAAE